jgi:hypothetical protein
MQTTEILPYRISNKKMLKVCGLTLTGLCQESGHAVPQFVEALRYKPEVAGSILNGVIEIFHFHPSGRTTAMGSTQPPTEISTRSISWV